jgi:hypothetical protein
MRSVFHPADVARKLARLQDARQRSATMNRCAPRVRTHARARARTLPGQTFRPARHGGPVRAAAQLHRRARRCETPPGGPGPGFSSDGLEVTPMLLLGPPGHRQNAFCTPARSPAGHGHEPGADEFHDRRLATLGLVSTVERRAPGQGLRGPGGRRICQSGDRGGRNRQGQPATRSTTRWAPSTASWSTTPRRALPTSLPTWP